MPVFKRVKILQHTLLAEECVPDSSMISLAHVLVALVHTILCLGHELNILFDLRGRF